MGVKEQSEGLERAIDHMCRKTRDLRRQLRKAVVDHVSDSFLETSAPLQALYEAAEKGWIKEVEEYALIFTEHANKLVEVNNSYINIIINRKIISFMNVLSLRHFKYNKIKIIYFL